MAIQKEFVLRYQEEGHVRFGVPEKVCNKEVAETLIKAIRAIDGVYRVNLYRNQKKLSIRFHASVCEFKSLAKQLFEILANLEKKGALVASPSLRGPAFLNRKVKTNRFSPLSWIKEKINNTKETVHAARVLTRVTLKKPKSFINDPEKAVVDFLNDILVLFLIKLHWQNITQQWIVKPFKYRYEWMALFYMFFLLIRSRKAK
ncbi:MAG: hypothetical protein Q8K19_19605 [Methylicorpusculum sp.]|uniref:hypothetical protein n=1 Tax=Methylicorpusculum sp. TaxID=2713644 RepID=UPI0027207D51|nr:hypothetical protein [Methylicorpusculum sp.]MDO8843470.1 hypothetical protein [Methylicorpusculum sp.]MDP2180714.1 hypothetical protein [Methylicorpusculum sp.]